jgi:hypothetical protein
MKRALVDFRALKANRAKELRNVVEVVQRTKFVNDISTGTLVNHPVTTNPALDSSGVRVNKGQIPNDKLKTVIDAGLTTFLLHT